MKETLVRTLGQKDPLEKGMTTHPGILAWRIPWTEEPGELHSSWGCKELGTTESLTLEGLYFFFPPHCGSMHKEGLANTLEHAISCGKNYFICYLTLSLGSNILYFNFKPCSKSM